MKKILFIFIFLNSSICYAGWEKVDVSIYGNVTYLDFKSLKKNNEYIYIWSLTDLLKPTKYGDLSWKSLLELDCNIPQKFRSISQQFFPQPMGKGTASTMLSEKTIWSYYEKGTAKQRILDAVCSN